MVAGQEHFQENVKLAFFLFYRFLQPSRYNNFKCVALEQRKLKIFGHFISDKPAGSE